MSASPSFPFDDLPIELQREIFIVAANLVRGSAIRLVLVARRVHSWLQPCIYDMVTLGSNDTALFLRTMETMPRPFFAQHVTKLCLSVSVRAKHAEHMLATCTGVNVLAFWVDYLKGGATRSLASLLSPLPLRRLSIELKHFSSLFSDPKLRHTWSQTLTHLEIIFWANGTAPVVPHLNELPSLTHLALRLLHRQAHESYLLQILLACKSLQVLVVFDQADTTTDATEETVWPTDPRVVCMPAPQNVVREWEAQARRDDDCSWSRAEDLIRRHTAERERSYRLSQLQDDGQSALMILPQQVLPQHDGTLSSPRAFLT